MNIPGAIRCLGEREVALRSGGRRGGGTGRRPGEENGCEPRPQLEGLNLNHCVLVLSILAWPFGPFASYVL